MRHLRATRNQRYKLHTQTLKTKGRKGANPAAFQEKICVNKEKGTISLQIESKDHLDKKFSSILENRTENPRAPSVAIYQGCRSHFLFCFCKYLYVVALWACSDLDSDSLTQFLKLQRPNPKKNAASTLFWPINNSVQKTPVYATKTYLYILN